MGDPPLVLIVDDDPDPTDLVSELRARHDVPRARCSGALYALELRPIRDRDHRRLDARTKRGPRSD